MGKQELEVSRAKGGAHHHLAEMAGDWEGVTRVWFEADKLADESPQRGSMRLIVGGRFVLHEYETAFQGKPQQGVAIYGMHLDAKACESAWVDSFHTGTSIMFSSGRFGDLAFAALGSYSVGRDQPRWSWRTEIQQPDPGHLVITMFNIPAKGKEAKAVETRYARRIAR